MIDRVKNSITWKRLQIGLYIVAMLAVAATIQLVVNRSFLDETKLVKTFEKTEATPVKGTLQVVGNFGDKYLTTEDKEKLIDHVSRQLGIKDTLEKKVVKGNTTISVAAKAESAAATTDIEAISITSGENEQIKQTTQYLYVTIDIFDNMSSVLGYKDIIEDTLDKVGLQSVDSSILLNGVYQGKLSLLDKNNVTEQILEDLQADVTAENRSNSIYTVYAYSPDLSKSLEIQGEKVNLNIGFSYNEEKDETTLYLASPIINQDY